MLCTRAQLNGCGGPEGSRYEFDYLRDEITLTLTFFQLLIALIHVSPFIPNSKGKNINSYRAKLRITKSEFYV